jgi:hypothetical protein
VAGVVGLVVEVVVDDEAVLAGAQVGEVDPREHADDVVAPVAGADEARRVGEPQVVVGEDLEPPGVPVHGGGLAPAAAEASEVDPVVVLEVGPDVLELAEQAFLCAEDRGSLAFEDVVDEGAALGPAVRRRVAFEAEVEGHEVEPVAGGRTDERGGGGLLGLGARWKGERGHCGGAERKPGAEQMASAEVVGHGTSSLRKTDTRRFHDIIDSFTTYES